MEELMIIELSKMIDDNIELSKEIYEKYIKPQIKKAEEKYETRKERIFEILKNNNEILMLCHQHIYEAIKDKDEYIKELEGIIKTKVLEQSDRDSD